MRSTLRIGLALLLLSGASMTVHADEETQNVEVVSQCVATFIFQGQREDVVLWKELFQLDNDRILHYYEMLKQMEDEDLIPRQLIKDAIVACRDIYDNVSAAAAKSPSQAPGLEGSE